MYRACGGSIGHVIKSGVARMLLKAMKVIACIPLMQHALNNLQSDGDGSSTAQSLPEY